MFQLLQRFLALVVVLCTLEELFHELLLNGLLEGQEVVLCLGQFL